MAKTVKKAEIAAVKPAEEGKAVETKVAEKVEAPKAKAAKATKTTKTAKTTAAKAKKTTKAAKEPKAAKTAAKSASKVKMFVEYQGKQVDLDAVVEAVKAAAGKSVKTLEVYVKPEDGAAYYVVNGTEGGKAEL